MLKLYKLDGKMAVECGSLQEWAEWMETNNRRVAFDEIGDIAISTVFLGIDHKLWGNGDPLLFETMVFYAERGNQTKQYFIWAEAEEGHREFVEDIKQQTTVAADKVCDLISKVRSDK